MEAFAAAKINLLLHVGERRDDGFHELESLAVFADIGDKLRFEEADDLSLTIDGPYAKGLEAEADNLVLRAARALAADAGLEPKAKIHLTKNLPVASGIGGGSADAAAALRGLVELWSLQTGNSAAKEIAATLGSDVPVCVESRPSWMEGRGEIVTRAWRVPAANILLVNPGIAVPTGPVFKALKTRTGIGKVEHLQFEQELWTLTELVKEARNDLEAPALEIAPVIGDVLALLRAQKQVSVARMSGSGATCFALFHDDEGMAEAAATVRAAHPAWWVAEARIIA
ncbi:MAG: 4-(cytidine 5'-diphospho)-2-C-methyl-D-erythritol kinase [Proteobacteria bacterium]|nr:4-(cytidine 5'-diphospho)-2-C-methyl-D-erythritol kinase [Pseudomonadota bacterium]